MYSTHHPEPEVSIVISLLSKASLNYDFTATCNTHQLEINLSDLPILLILIFSIQF